MDGDKNETIDPCGIYNKLLTAEDYDGFLNVLKKRNNKELEFDTYDIITTFFTHLNQKVKHKMVVLFEESLKHLAQTCNPRNLLIIFTEKIHETDELQDIIFFQFLDPIFICLDRIEFPKARALSIVLNEFYRRISYLKLPKDYALENKERKLLVFDKNCQTINKWVINVQNRIQVFVEKTFNNFECIQKYNNECKEILKFEIRLLSKPLAFLDLSCDNKALVSDSRNVAAGIIRVINHLQADAIKLIDQCQKENDRNCFLKKKSPKEMRFEDTKLFEDQLYPDMGISVYSYLVFGEHLQDYNFPKVYSPSFLFLKNLCLISRMLFAKCSLLTHKGLHLSIELMKRMCRGMLDQEHLESREFHDFLGGVSFVASFSKVNSFNYHAMQIIATFVKVFKFGAHSKVLFLLLSKFSKPGVTGVIVRLIKDEIVECHQKPEQIEALEVEKLYQIVFCLPEAECSDLLQCSELIVSALNLLNFLVTYDPPSKNITKIWTHVPTIKKEFLTQLGLAIELSRSHYNLEIDKLKDRRKVEGVKELDQQQMYCFNKSIQTFDLLKDMLSKATSVIKFEENKFIKL